MCQGRTALVRLTCDGEQHGESGERPGQSLSTHEHCAVFLRQQAYQAKKASLHHRSKSCTHTHIKSIPDTDVKSFFFFLRKERWYLQFINQIVAMVMEKKWSCFIGTFTRMAVRMKRISIKTRLPAIRIFSEILTETDSPGGVMVNALKASPCHWGFCLFKERST